MKETGFIKQNKEKWIEFEKILHLKKKDPERLSNLFVQITDDLSYSRTFYPNRSVRVYLNNIAQQVFYSIYKNKREKGSRFMLFWKDELPRLVYESGREMRLSFGVFIISLLLGIISCYNDPEFLRVVVGDEYVEMTKANIEKGDPMAVYKEMHQVDMFFGIAWNNIQVAFLIFLLGVFSGIGTISILVLNGIMVGVFQYFFIQRGLFMESFLTIWMHGTLEMASMVVAGGAGLVLGKGLVFPGTYSRIESFQISARRGLKVLMGCVPIIVFAALIESFVTRYSDAHWILKGSVILFSLLFIIGYFVYYPLMKARKGFITRPQEAKLPPTVDRPIDLNTIKTTGEVFSDAFIFLRKHARTVMLTCLCLAAAYTIMFMLLFSDRVYYDFTPQALDFISMIGNAFLYLGDLGIYFSISEKPLLMIANIILFSVLATAAAHLWNTAAAKQKQTAGANVVNFFRAFLVLLVTSLITWVHPVFFFLLLIFAFPILVCWLAVSQAEQGNVFSALGSAFKIVGSHYWSLVFLNFIFTVVSVIFLFLVSSPIVWLFFDLFISFFDLDADDYRVAVKIMVTFASFTALGLLFTMAYSGYVLFYHSAREAAEAISLKQKINNLRAGKQRAATA